jgi:hypothetical protein
MTSIPVSTAAAVPVTHHVINAVPLATATNLPARTKIIGVHHYHETSKYIYLGILFLTFMIILGIMVFLIFAKSQNKWPFKVGQPKLLNAELIYFNSSSNPAALPNPNPTALHNLQAAATDAAATLKVAASTPTGVATALFGAAGVTKSGYGSGNALSTNGTYAWKNSSDINPTDLPCFDPYAAADTPCPPPP